MAVIVQHKEAGSKYILLGAGFGAYKASRPGAFLGNLAPVTDSGEIRVVLVSDAAGSLEWIASDMLGVLSVDGEAPGNLLDGS